MTQRMRSHDLGGQFLIPPSWMAYDLSFESFTFAKRRFEFSYLRKRTMMNNICLGGLSNCQMKFR